jgi:hypothetical protein
MKVKHFARGLALKFLWNPLMDYWIGNAQASKLGAAIRNIFYNFM